MDESGSARVHRLTPVLSARVLYVCMHVVCVGVHACMCGCVRVTFDKHIRTYISTCFHSCVRMDLRTLSTASPDIRRSEVQFTDQSDTNNQTSL